MAGWKEFLGTVPGTIADNVISLRGDDPDAPPPALDPTWRAISRKQREIAELHAQKEDFKRRADEAQRMAAEHIAKAEREIERKRKDLDDEVGRLVMMLNGLNLHISDEIERSTEVVKGEDA